MALEVNKDLCIACGVCQSLCPDAFDADDEGKAVIKDANCADPCVDDAIANCPVEAITK